jgi:hypothetical protein
MKKTLIFALFTIVTLRGSCALAKEEASDEQLQSSARRMSCALKLCRRLEQAGKLSPPFIDINQCVGVKANERACTGQGGGRGRQNPRR